MRVLSLIIHLYLSGYLKKLGEIAHLSTHQYRDMFSVDFNGVLGFEKEMGL